jgi:hypothetical protein
MTKSYYECHITMEPTPRHLNRGYTQAIVEAYRWKFSAIDGDPVTGPGVKLYATRHYNLKLGDEAVLQALHHVADAFIAAGINVTRRKVERVIYDDRSSKVRPCSTACPECHLDDLRSHAAAP